MKLLVRAPNWVGDVIMSVPALRALRDAQPAPEIAVLARPGVAEIYAREPFADQVMVYENIGLRGKSRLAAELRARHFDCALLLPNSFDSALITWLARIPRRIGYTRDGRRWLLTDPIETPAPGSIPRHERFYYLELLRLAGFIDAIPACDRIRIGADPEAGRAALRSFGLDAARVIGLSPGAAFGGAKRWLPERFASAASTLAAE